MKTNKETIEKFRQAYFEEFGEEITPKQPYDNFSRLVWSLKDYSKIQK